jgi:hypothetical protein
MFFANTRGLLQGWPHRRFSPGLAPKKESESQEIKYKGLYLHRETFTHRGLYTKQLLHTDGLPQKSSFTHIRFYTQKLVHRKDILQRKAFTRRAFTNRCFYTEKP